MMPSLQVDLIVILTKEQKADVVEDERVFELVVGSYTILILIVLTMFTILIILILTNRWAATPTSSSSCSPP